MVGKGTYKRKYNPQLDAPPTRFGIKPRYKPDHPSCLTQSLNAEYTAVPSLGLVDSTIVVAFGVGIVVCAGDPVAAPGNAVGRELFAS